MLRRSMLSESGAMEADFDADDQGSSFHAGREICGACTANQLGDVERVVTSLQRMMEYSL